MREAAGKLLRKWRDRTGLTLQEVETFSRMETPGRMIKGPYLSQIENGKLPTPRLGMVFQLARIYRIPQWEVLQGIKAIFGIESPLQHKAEQIEKAFDYVLAMDDFPKIGPGGLIDPKVLSQGSLEEKLCMIRLYERFSKLRILPSPRSDPA